jgi:hypothetical protein
MIRKTILGLAAAAAVATAAASSASAGVSFYFGAPYIGGYYGPTYYAPTYCKKVIVGYKTVWNGYGWIQVPVKKKICGYY